MNAWVLGEQQNAVLVELKTCQLKTRSMNILRFDGYDLLLKLSCYGINFAVKKSRFRPFIESKAAETSNFISLFYLRDVKRLIIHYKNNLQGLVNKAQSIPLKNGVLLKDSFRRKSAQLERI